MKLLYCPHCGDVFNLAHRAKSCSCGRSSGIYGGDGLHATIDGDAIPLGFENASFVDALKHRPYGGGGAWTAGRRFDAFVMPHYTTTVNDGDYT